MDNKPSIVQSFRRIVVMLILVLTVMFSGLWAAMEITRFNAESRAIRDSSMAREKAAIRQEVDHILGYIDYKRKTTEKRARLEVRSRTEQAHDMVDFIYKKNSQASSPEEIRKIIYNALHSASWDDGRGYYFVINTEGVLEVNRNNSGLEGENILDQRDGRGTHFVREILKTARLGAQGGFCLYYWNKPGSPEIQQPKISYVKLFAPLGWVIGTGLYLEDQEETLRSEVLDWMENAHLDRSRYLFAGTWDGVSLLGPAAGKNMLEVTDVNGVEIVRELIERSLLPADIQTIR